MTDSTADSILDQYAGDILAGPQEPEESPLAAMPEPITPDPQTAPEAVGSRALQGALGSTAQGLDYFDRLASLTQQNNELVALYGDKELRANAAAQERDENLQRYIQDLTQFRSSDPTGAGRDYAVAAVQYELSIDEQRRQSVALERQTIRRIRELAAAGNSTEAGMMIDQLEAGSVVDQIQHFETVRLALSNRIADAQRELDARPFRFGLMTLADFVSSMVPFNVPWDMSGLVPTTQGQKNWYDWIFAGERAQQEVGNLWNMSTEDAVAYIDDVLVPKIKEKASFFGVLNRSEQVALLSSFLDTPSAFDLNTTEVMNYTALPFAKVGSSILGGFVRMGARSSGVEIAAAFAKRATTEGTEAAARATGLTVEEGADALKVAAINDGAAPSRVGIALEADNLRRGEAIVRAVLDEDAPNSIGRLTDEEVAAVRERARLQVEEEFQTEVRDVSVGRVTYADGRFNEQIEFTIGRKGGGGFKPAKGADPFRFARNRAETLGLTEGRDFRFVTDEAGQVFLRVFRDAEEEAAIILKIPGGADNALARFTLGGHLISDKAVHAASVAAGDRLARFREAIEGTARKAFGALRNRERISVSNALDFQARRREWFTPDQMQDHWRTYFGREITAREQEAMFAAQGVSDAAYYLRNTASRINLVRQGYRGVELEHPVANSLGVTAAKVSDVPTSYPQRIYNLTDSEHILELTPERAATLQAEGYQLIQTIEAVRLRDGTRISSFVAKRGSVKVGNLPQTVTGYIPGGPNIYDPVTVTHFLRQTRRGVQPDTGKEFLDTPMTHAGGTEAEMNFLAQRLENARQLYLRARNETVKKPVGPRGGLRSVPAMDENDLVRSIEEIFQGHAGLPEPEEFIRGLDGYIDETGVRKFDYQKTEPFEVNPDRVMPKAYNDTTALQFMDEDASGLNGWMARQGRMFYSRRGETALPGFNGKPAPVLDAYSAIGRSIRNAVGETSLGDYKIEMIDRWLKTYGEFFELPANASSARQFLEAAPRIDAPHKIVNIAKSNRDVITRTLRWQTELDREAVQQQARFNDFLFGDDPNSVRAATGKKIAHVLDKHDPVETARWFVSNIKLGVGNPGQFLLQTGTMVAATTMSPRLGMIGIESVLHMKVALRRMGAGVAVDYGKLAKSLKLSSPAEAKAYLARFRNSGFNDINSHTMQDQLGSTTVLSRGGNAVADAADRGMFFFNEAERWNRLTAFRIAWGEAVEKYGAEAASSESSDFYRFLGQRAHDYSMNMTQASASWWQRGIFRIPTQFWGYNARMMEAMLGDTFASGRKDISIDRALKSKRIRLALGQIFFWGAAGTPITSTILEGYRAMTGTDPDLGTPGGLVARGAVDNFLYAVTGFNPETSWDLQVGSRLGTGGWLRDVVQELFGMSEYGPTSPMDFMTGATAKIMGEVTSSAWDIFKYIAAESGEESKPLTERALLGLASEISTVSNVHKALLVMNLGIYESKRGNVLARGLPASEAFAVALGIAPGELNELGAKRAFNQNRSKKVREMSAVINQFRARMVNDPEHADEIQEQINAYVRLLPPEIKKDVLRRARKDVDPSVLDSVTETWQKNIDAARAAQAQEDALNGETN